MPELPEVQTVVNDLNKKVLGRRITGVWFDTPKMIKIIFADKRGFTRKGNGFQRIFEKEIKGLKIKNVKRRGKNILIYLTKSYKLKAISYILLIHQKMTGHLLIGKWRIVKGKALPLFKGALSEKVNDYIHLIFYLDNGWQLALSDLRKFAKVVFGPKEEMENLPELKNLGPDALKKSFKVEKFIKLIKSEKRKIKQVLLDQGVIAGIGNIYSDDMLWQAKIHPLSKASQLKANQLKSLYVVMRQILKMALKLRGISISDFRDTSGKAGSYGDRRLVYRREGEPCRRCGTKIERVKLGGRSSCFCPMCQKN
ncbi:DNA-formamidopyrimidine glycosylase [Candidatus Wolfebacteria bacterium]|nr:DNA-formamidopyrimidine glycosylase [Candidatus Wolfebacteria bacterium]